MDFPLAIEEWDTSSEEKCGRVISPFVTQGTSQFLCASQVFPTYGLAVVVKKNPPLVGIAVVVRIPPLVASPLVVEFSPRLLFPLVVEFFSPRLLSHSWGKLVTCTGIGMYLS